MNRINWENKINRKRWICKQLIRYYKDKGIDLVFPKSHEDYDLTGSIKVRVVEDRYYHLTNKVRLLDIPESIDQVVLVTKSIVLFFKNGDWENGTGIKRWF